MDRYDKFVRAYAIIYKPTYIALQVGDNKYRRECKYCKSRSVVSENLQLRSADEESSIILRCENCGVSEVLR